MLNFSSEDLQNLKKFESVDWDLDFFAIDLPVSSLYTRIFFLWIKRETGRSIAKKSRSQSTLSNFLRFCKSSDEKFNIE